MSATSTTYAGRVAAERLMLDAGKALRPTGGYEYDPAANGGLGGDVLETAALFGSDVAPVACKIQTRNLVARESEVGERTSVSVRTELHIPAASPRLEAGDIWQIVTAHSLSLSEVGQQLRVVAPVAGTLKTAARYEVEEVVS